MKKDEIYSGNLHEYNNSVFHKFVVFLIYTPHPHLACNVFVISLLAMS